MRYRRFNFGDSHSSQKHNLTVVKVFSIKTSKGF